MSILGHKDTPYIVGVLLLSLLVFAVAQTGSRVEEMTHDSAHYLELARSITRGEGFRTHTLWALNIPVDGVAPRDLSASDIARPDVYRAPLYPLLIAAASYVVPDLFDAGKWVAALTGALVPVLVFLFLRRRLALSIPISLIGAVIAVFHHHLVISGTRALTESPYTAAILATLLVLTGPRPRPLIGGLLTGVSWLLRFQALIVVPCALLAFTVPGRTRRRWLTDVALYAMGFFVVAGPWMIRNVHVAGSPLYTDLRYHMVSTYDPDLTTYQYFHGLDPVVPPREYIAAHPDQTVDHLILSVKKIGRQFPQENAGNIWFGFVALAGGLLWLFRRRKDWRLFVALTYFGLANVGLVAISFVDHRHLTSLDPIVVMLIALCIAEIWRVVPQKLPRAATIAAVAVGLVWESHVAYEFNAPYKPQYYEFAEASEEYLLPRLQPDDAVMGEKPYYLSFLYDRPAVSLPWCSDADFLALAKRLNVRYACVGGFNEEHFGDPYPGSFLDTGELPAWLRPVLRVEDPPLVVYEVDAMVADSTP